MEQNVDPNFGYNTQGVQGGTLGFAPVPPQGVGPGMVGGIIASGAPSIESSAIFQAANQQPNPTNVTPANNVVDTTPAPQWMTNQPLSAGNIESTTVQENNVMSANKREELERRKNKQRVCGENTAVEQGTIWIKPSKIQSIAQEIL